METASERDKSKRGMDSCPHLAEQGLVPVAVPLRLPLAVRPPAASEVVEVEGRVPHDLRTPAGKGSGCTPRMHCKQLTLIIQVLLASIIQDQHAEPGTADRAAEAATEAIAGHLLPGTPIGALAEASDLIRHWTTSRGQPSTSIHCSPH